MDKFKCQITDMSRDYKTGEYKITLATREKIFEFAEKLLDFDLSCLLKRYRKDRSLDANAYCWVLLDKLAVTLKLPKEELYRDYIRQMGGNSATGCFKNEAVNDLIKNWESNGIGWQADTFDSKFGGCTNVILYYGSSTYDTEQMSRLIELIVQDCKALGIETKTPDELAELKARWGENG
jgi:hypothetical protein